MSRPIGMGAAALVVSASVLLSRLLGLGREALLAALIGVNTEGDLYRQAFTIPDFLSYLLAGAYLTITLIPILSRHLEGGDADAASRAFTSVYRFVGVGILALTILMWALAGPLVSLLFPEVPDPERLVGLTRLVLPAQVFLVMGAVLIAVQYAHKRFFLPALAPIIYNLGIIVGGLIGTTAGEPSPESFLLGAVAGSAVGNFGLQWLGARRTGTWLLLPRPGESAVGEYLLLALPLMVGQSIAVLDEQFVRFFGQLEDGATSALSFARQLNMVPVGLVAQAAGVAAFPFLARLAARGDEEDLVATTARAAGNTVFLATLATAALVVLASPLVRVIYGYGQFTTADAELVASLLVIYSFSIPAWGLHQILARHFYAKRRMWTPVLIGTAFTAIAIPVWLLLFDRIGVSGLALASTLVMIGYALGMLIAWGTDSGWGAVRRLIPSLLRGAIAAGVAVAAGLPLVNALTADGPSTPGRAAGVAALGALTVLAAFMLVAALLRSPELRSLRGQGRRPSGQTT